MSSPSPPLVQIPNVSAAQLVGSERIPLQSGTLTLALPHSGSPDTKLLLSIGSFTIPLSESSIVGTNNSLTYLFTFSLSETDTGFVEVKLPPSADDETTKVSEAATEFEGVLVRYGFLKAGLVADADDMARALKEAAARTAERWTAQTDSRVEGRDGVEEYEEAKFSDTTHKVVNSAVEGSRKLAELSGKLSNAVSGAAFEAGKWIGEKLGSGSANSDSGSGGKEKSLPQETANQVMEATSVTVSGLGQSAAHISSTLGESTSRIAEHEQGQEVKGLVESARETAGNAGQIAVDATRGTSVVWQAGEAGVGAAKAG
jgi:hypothetical protein